MTPTPTAYDLEQRPGESRLVLRRLHAFAELLDAGESPTEAARQVATHEDYGVREFRDKQVPERRLARLTGQFLARVVPGALEQAQNEAVAVLSHHAAEAATTAVRLFRSQAADKDDAAGAKVRLDACRLVLECIGLGRGARNVAVDARQVHIHGASEHADALGRARQLLEGEQ